MYTMKIILLDILLICAIAEIFAKWSSTDTDMTIVNKIDTLRTDSHEEEAKQDILDVINSQNQLHVNFEGLHDLPLEQLLAAGLPPADKMKKPKKKVKKPKPKSKFIKYYGPPRVYNSKKPDSATMEHRDHLGNPIKHKFPKKYLNHNFGQDYDIPHQPLFMTNSGNDNYPDQSEEQSHAARFHPPTTNTILKVDEIPLSAAFAQEPYGEKFVDYDNYDEPYEQKIQNDRNTHSVPQTEREIADHYNSPVEKLMDDPTASDEFAKLLDQLQASHLKEHTDSEDYDHDDIINWQKEYKNVLKQMKMESGGKNPKKSYREGDIPGDLVRLKKFSSNLIDKLFKMAKEDDSGEIESKSISQIIKEKSNIYFNKFKKYMQGVLAKLLNKAVRQSEEKKKIRQGHFRHHRSKRQTQAGYTQDPDTCQKYNDNLLKMWETMSKYLNSTDSVNEIALHNIAVMVEAYLDHQNKNSHETKIEVTREERKKDKISEILRKIKKLLGTDDATDKVKEMVLENFKPEYDDDAECKQINEDNLVSSIALSYKNYLDNAKCRGDYDTGLLRGKALLRRGLPPKTDIELDSNFREMDDNIHKSILNEDESSEDFNRGKLLIAKRSKQRSGGLRSREKRSPNRYYKSNRDKRFSKGRSSMLRRKQKKKPYKKLSRDRKRPHMRTDESCVKYANRKFLITLRTSIERFMALRDCQHDDTLRTSNKNKDKNDDSLRTVNKDDNKVYDTLRNKNDNKEANDLRTSDKDDYKDYDTLRTSSKNVNKVDDDLRTSNKNKDHDNLRTTSKNENKVDDNLGTPYKNNYKDYDNLRTSSKNENKVYDNLRTSSKNENKVDDNLRTSNKNKDYDNLRTSSKNVNKVDDDLRTSNKDSNKNDYDTLRTENKNYNQNYDTRSTSNKNNYKDYDTLRTEDRDSNKNNDTLGPSNMDDNKNNDSLRISNKNNNKEDDALRKPKRNKKLLKSATYVPVMRTPNERNYIERKLYSDTELGQREQSQISNYLSKIKDFEGQDPSKMNKPIYVVHSSSYKSPVLLKIKNKPEVVGPNSVLLHYPTSNINKNYAKYNIKSKYNLDSVYKSFLDSSNMHSKNTLFSTNYGMGGLLKTKQKLGGNDVNLYEVLKKKIAEHGSKGPFDTIARQSDDSSNPFADSNKTNLTNDDFGNINLTHGSSDGVSVNFNAIGDILNEVHNSSLQNPQVDMISFASESEKGYVELSYLVKYPKSIVYRPQYLVKNILQYEDFVKVASQIYVTDDDRQLLKIVRYLPDNSTQTLFETQDFKSPLEIRDTYDDKKLSSPFATEETSTTSEVPQLRQQVTSETDYSDYENQTQTDVPALDSSPENKTTEDDLRMDANRNEFDHEDSDYVTYQDEPTADGTNTTLNSTDDSPNVISNTTTDTPDTTPNSTTESPDVPLNSTIDSLESSLNSTAIQRSNNESDLGLDSAANSTEYKDDSDDTIDERIIEILNASLNSGEFVSQDLSAIGSNISSLGKDGGKIDAESIADYLRFKLNTDANLSTASHAYLKELESQGVSTTALTKSMLRTWWESWKNKLSTKVQSIAGRVSSLLKKLERPSSSPTVKVVEKPFEGL